MCSSTLNTQIVSRTGESEALVKSPSVFRRVPLILLEHVVVFLASVTLGPNRLNPPHMWFVNRSSDGEQRASNVTDHMTSSNR